MLDSVIEDCLALTKLDCNLYQLQSSAINLKKLEEKEKPYPTIIKPRPLIKGLRLEAKIDTNQTVHYLMQKYSQLNSLTINQFNDEDYREDSDGDDEEPKLGKNFA